MTVWIVEGVWAYEGSVILGVFDSEQKAFNCKEKIEQNERVHYDSIDVSKVEVE